MNATITRDGHTFELTPPEALPEDLKLAAARVSGTTLIGGEQVGPDTFALHFMERGIHWMRLGYQRVDGVLRAVTRPLPAGGPIHP